MSDRTTWVLDFDITGLDKGAVQATRLDAALNKLLTEEEKLNIAFQRTQSLKPFSDHENAAKSFGNQLQNTGQSAIQLGAMMRIGEMGVNALVDGLKMAARALSEFDSQAVKAFGERTSTIRAYTTILGDARQAQVEYGKANELASKTELTAASTLKAQQALIVAGFRGGDLQNALTASMDVAATKQPEEREATMERMGRAFSQILGSGKFRGEELGQLAEAGVNRGMVLELLGKGNAGKGEKLISSGSVTAQEGIAAVQQAILQTLGTKKLGEFATGASGSLGGLLSNRDEAMDILLKSFEGESLPAVIRYKQALTEQTNALATSSETGKGLVMMLSDFSSITSNVKTIWTDFSTSFLESFVASYNEAREGDGAFVSMTSGIKTLGQTLGKVGSVVGEVADAFEGLMGTLSPIAAWLGNMITGLGDMYSAIKSGDMSAARDAMDSIMEGPDRVVRVVTQDGNESSEKIIDLDERDRERANEARYKSRQAAADAAKAGKGGEGATKTKWGKSSGAGGSGGGKGMGGYDITGLLGGSGGGMGSSMGDSGEGNSASAGLAMRFQSAIGAAAAQSSAPSTKAQAEGSMGMGGGLAGMGAMNVSIAAGAIVVNGVSDPVMAANEVYRLFGQMMGRVTRAPGAGTL